MSNDPHDRFGIVDQLRRVTLAVRPEEATIWVHGETPQQFQAAQSLIQPLLAGEPLLRLFLTSRSPATLACLRRLPQRVRVQPPPLDLFSGRFLRRIRPRLIMLLDGGRSFPPKLLSKALHAGLCVAVAGPPSIPQDLCEAWPGSLVFCEPDIVPDDVMAKLRALTSISTPMPAAPPVRFSRNRLWQAASGWLTTRRIDDWPTLRERLRNPKVVLCLGNGPSSEDPRLAGIAHDCLIRVNWRWQHRGLLTRPDMVFVGDLSTVRKVPPCLFGCLDRTLESALLLRHLIARGPRRMEYVTMERLSPLIVDRQWAARPTNGALMIVAAVGLRPERIVISGMDLFQHSVGPYPGDGLSPNRYTLRHSRDVDLEIIDLALRDYEGEVVILSDILRDALARLRDKPGAKFA